MAPAVRKKRKWKIAACALATLLALWVAATAYIYCTAPVETLRGIVTYTPPFKHYQRQAGLALPDNLQIKDIPPPLLMVVLAAEDADFHQHIGFSPQRIYWSTKYYLTRSRHWGGVLSGASSLTQQLVKNIFTGPERSLLRKYVELIYALKTERYFTKEEIYTLYINMAQVGPDSYGYQQGAHDYFGKDFKDLSLIEAVLIVNAMPSPVKRTAWLREGKPDKTVYRRISVLLGTTYGLMNNYAGWADMSVDEKEHVFSRFMLSPARMECGYKPWEDEMMRQARRETEAFMKKHWKGDIRELKGA